MTSSGNCSASSKPVMRSLVISGQTFGPVLTVKDAATLAATTPVIRIHNTAGQDGTIRAQVLPGHFESEPLKAAKCGQVRALEGSVKHEGLAVERSRSRQSDSLPRSSPQLKHQLPCTPHSTALDMLLILKSRFTPPVETLHTRHGFA